MECHGMAWHGLAWNVMNWNGGNTFVHTANDFSSAMKLIG